MSARTDLSVRFTKIATHFVVEDVADTADYYCSRLGFTRLGYFGDPPVFAMVQRDGVEMHFGKADARPQGSNEQLRRGLGADAYIWVTNIQDLFQELVLNEVDIVEGPVKRIYGSTEIVVRDRNGMTLVFGD